MTLTNFLTKRRLLIEAKKAIITGHGVDSYDSFMLESIAQVVYGSNLIERAGVRDYSLTSKICKRISLGLPVDPSTSGVTKQSLKEIEQHVLALNHMLTEMVAKNKPLSEKLILQTHYILCNGIPTSDGDTGYAGAYRQVAVGAGLHSFTAPGNVTFEMGLMIRQFNADISKAQETGELDPFNLASKYCHKFVNIHPFWMETGVRAE